MFPQLKANHIVGCSQGGVTHNVTATNSGPDWHTLAHNLIIGSITLQHLVHCWDGWLLLWLHIAGIHHLFPLYRWQSVNASRNSNGGPFKSDELRSITLITSGSSTDFAIKTVPEISVYSISQCAKPEMHPKAFSELMLHTNCRLHYTGPDFVKLMWN